MSEQLIQTPGVFGDNGNFLLERELGAGGMGGVYMGRDKMLDRPVAVKVMLKELGADAEFVEKFKKEAQAAARLIHPNIVQVYSYGISEGMPYIAMELAAGGSLFSLMNVAPGKTDIQRVLKICQQTAQALQCASDQGVVHGDIKPENILLDSNGNAKLVDFGLAAMQKETDEIWGTPYYISPEKVKKDPIDFKSDMYSLGATLYHALTGVAPFEGDDSVAVVKKRFESIPRKPSEIRAEISPAVDALVMKMIEREKDKRYPSFEALLQAFTDVLTSGLTQKNDQSSAQKKPMSSSPTAGKRVTVRGRRVMMKKPSSIAPRHEEDETKEDEEEEGGNLGAKVALFVVGGLVAIGAIVGGLFWFISANEKAKEEEFQSQVVSKIAEARTSIQGTRDLALKFDNEFKEYASRATSECEKFTVELKKLLPDFADQMKPLEKANTNVTAKTTTEVPVAVKDINELWERAYNCQASQTKISLAAKKIVEECDKDATVVTETEESARALGDISMNARGLYDQMIASPEVVNVRKGIAFIKSKGEKTIRQTIRELTITKAEADRAAKAAAQKKTEEDYQKRKAEEKAAQIEKETSEISAKFDSIAAQGCFRQLDWKSALRQLDNASEFFKTAEGQLAKNLQVKKVNNMKKVQDIFIAKLKGYTFKGKLKNYTVVSVDEKEISILKNEKNAKKPIKIAWQKFYKDYPGNFNEVINHFIVNGRKNAGLSLRDWADAMVGAALTMRLVCADIDGATAKAEMLSKEVVKQFPDYEKTMKEIFPDMSFDGATEE